MKQFVPTRLYVWLVVDVIATVVFIFATAQASSAWDATLWGFLSVYAALSGADALDDIRKLKR